VRGPRGNLHVACQVDSEPVDFQLPADSGMTEMKASREFMPISFLNPAYHAGLKIGH